MSFKTYLQNKGLAQSSSKHYMAEVAWYKRFLKQKGIALENTTQKEVLAYLKSTKRPSLGRSKKKTRNLVLSNGSKKAVLGALNHFYCYLIDQERIEKNPTELIKIRGAKRQFLRPLLTLEEMEQFYDLYADFTRHYTPTTYQSIHYNEAYALVMKKRCLALSLLLYQGLHIEELLSLEKEQFNLHKATLRLHKKKRINARTLPLEAVQMGLLLGCFDTEQPLPLISRGQLHRMSEVLKKHYPKFEDFKQLRASRIVYWIKTHGLRKAQVLAGHRYISSTEYYLPNDFEDLQNQLEHFHPLG